MPQITRTEKGFINQIENAEVQYLECNFTEKICTVHFYRKPPKELHIDCSSFNLQYGIPVSDDGTQLFFSDWDHGLWAYDLDSGEVNWYSPTKHLTYFFVDSSRLIAVQQNQALICFDIQTGVVLQKVTGGSIADAFMIDHEHILVNSMRGRLCAVNLTDLSVYKWYSNKIVNPYNCLSIMFHRVSFHDDILKVIGQEDSPKQSVQNMYWPHYFERIIDQNFIGQERVGSSAWPFVSE